MKTRWRMSMCLLAAALAPAAVLPAQPAAEPGTRPADPMDASLYARGVRLFEEGQFAEALACLDKEINDRPQNVSAYLYAALCAEGRKDWTAAADYWRDYGLLTEQDAQRQRAQLRRAYCLSQVGRETTLPATSHVALPALPPLPLTEKELAALSVYEPQATTVRNEHFVVTAHNKALAELIAERSKLYLKSISAFLLGDRLWPHVTDIVVYKDRQTYAAAGRMAHWSGGGFRFRRNIDGTAERCVDLFQFDEEGRFRGTLISVVLPHELCHVVVTEFFGDREPPLWLNEGLAMLAEDVDPLWRQRPLLGPLQEGTVDSWRTLFSRDQVDRAHVGEFYAQAASVTRFLAEELDARQFATLLAEIKAGQDSLTALSRATGATGARWLEDLEDRWKKKTLRKLLQTTDEKSVGPDAPAGGRAGASSP